MVAALPGILLLIASVALLIVLFLVSILALLLLTVPLFRVLSALCGVKPGVVMPAGSSGFGPVPEGMEPVIDQASGETPPVTVVEAPQGDQPRPARRQIEVKIVE
jgi:UPF0716 family protein affecting phage T7 exclusion